MVYILADVHSRFLPVTVFILLSAAAGAGIITSYLGAHANRFLLHRCGISHVFFVIFIVPASVGAGIFLLTGSHPAHIRFFFMAFADLPVVGVFSDGDGRFAEKGND